MLKKNLTKPRKKLSKPTKITKKLTPKSSTKPEQNIITENLKRKVLPHIVNDFAQALKSLKTVKACGSVA
ncbi:MAG: hypothetical protein mread185_000576 [Mycoplasmataceae bacterium]|nr:MAG: hypothetical protein mread185_000576 [Mycoplasmataceae bacterium]